MKEEKSTFTVRSYTKSELAHLYNPQLTLKNATQVLRRWILHNAELHAELIRKDWFMTLLDFKAYAAKKEEALKAYEDRKAWAKKMVVNISKAGYFSSDRTIAEYNNDIWHVQ